MDSNEPLRQQLQSFPGLSLSLPAGSQVLTPEVMASPALERRTLLETIQKRVLEVQATSGRTTSHPSCRLLLLLPDKTRRQTAAHLAVDALVDLCERNHRFTLTLLFGLGTHPLMPPEDVTRILGPERQQRLNRLQVALHQQTTLNPLPLRRIQIADPLKINGNKIAIQMPEMLWDCDLLLVAGDTDLHPYEGRAGSGGINKMLAIGVGCLSTIRMTHSLDILTDPLTRPGEQGNRFVQLVDHFAKEIISALRPPHGPLIADPIGISAVAHSLDQPEAFWIGDQEKQRVNLMQPLKQERTVTMREAIDVVIADTEEEKGTDLLAGARSLHFLCNFNDRNNPILCVSSPCRTALLFNSCHEVRNAHGIGNSGTVLHLQALHQFSLDTYEKALQDSGSGLNTMALPLAQRLRTSQALKNEILNRWECYLHLVSEEEKVFGKIEQELERLALTKNLNNVDDKAKTKVLKQLDEVLPHSFGPHRHLLAGTRQRLLRSDSISALSFLRQTSDQLGFKGLGEGGQRALRLLAILRTFDQFYIATDNPVVLEFLRSFHPDQAPRSGHPTSGKAEHEGPNLGLIGLFGISLQDHTPQQALDIALRNHDLMLKAMQTRTTAGVARPRRRLAFLQQPVILRLPSRDEKEAGDPSPSIKN